MAARAAASATRATTSVRRAASRSSSRTFSTMAPMSSGGDPALVRRRIAARLRRPNTSWNRLTPRARDKVPSPAHACVASSTNPKDGSAAVTPPPAAQWASCRRSPSPAIPLA
eukprot:4643104-Pleurochrysis_carterae.AAC.1